ncbi:MAG TPA: hypothetical protein VFU96_02080, partial [Acidimicrobiia bacterium]|nr:hypothetical protein [Acidimicrobiia bacterium]
MKTKSAAVTGVPSAHAASGRMLYLTQNVSRHAPATVVVGAAVVVVSGVVVFVIAGAAVVVGSASSVQATAAMTMKATTTDLIETALLTVSPRSRGHDRGS